MDNERSGDKDESIQTFHFSLAWMKSIFQWPDLCFFKHLRPKPADLSGRTSHYYYLPDRDLRTTAIDVRYSPILSNLFTIESAPIGWIHYRVLMGINREDLA